MNVLLLISILAAVFVAVFLVAKAILDQLRKKRSRSLFRESLQGGQTASRPNHLYLGARVAALLPTRKRRGAGRLIHEESRLQAQLPQLLDVTVLGLRAGLSFDAAFGMYIRYFQGELRDLCKPAYDAWRRGIRDRTACLTDLAEAVALPEFKRFSQIAAKALRYGASMADMLAELSQQTRANYAALHKERIAKAPVKMLLPTCALILPAMMLLILGPIMLNIGTSL
jgi:tight adherence protein C